MCYMLDTNICVYATRCEDAALLEKLEGFFAGDLVMSAITLAELEAGVRRDAGLRHRRQQALAELVRFIEPVAFDERTAACFGELQVAMWRTGDAALTTGLSPRMPSACGCPWSNNVRDFQDMPGLRFENWAAE